MTFDQILKHLDRIGEFRMRLDLAPTRKLLELLAHPDRSLKSVIVSGTNGKGSTCAFLTSIARAAGIRVGTFMSPHLSFPTERIAIDGAPIDKEIFGRLATELIGTFDRGAVGPVTYFEFLTMMSLLIFVHQRVELAIFEVGLGGRLDSTNTLERIGTITTTIDYDHTAILGKTLAEIAKEKGAILRKDLPAVIGEQAPEAQEALLKIVNSTQARGIVAGRDFNTTGDARSFSFLTEALSVGPMRLGLRGDHQVGNAACAAAMAVELAKQGFPITANAIEEGLGTVIHPARLERWRTPDGKEIWLDVAHNPGAARKISLFFQKEELTPLDLVVGILSDKDWQGILNELLPIAKSFTLCRPSSPRAWDPSDGAKSISGKASVAVVDNPLEALETALKNSKRVLVTGSFYVVGAVRTYLARKAKLSSN